MVDFRSPRVPFVVAALLCLVAVALAVIGIGSPVRGGDLPPGTVTVAGVDPSAGGVVEVDMSRPISVVSTDSGAAELSVVVLGQSFGGQQVALLPGATTQVPAPVNRYVLAGALTGQLVIKQGETITATQYFAIRTTQPAYTTALAVGVVVLALFAAAYVESYIRALRRGRNRVSGSFGLPFSAAVLSVAMVGAVWVVLGREPTIATVIGCAVVAGAAGIAATVGSMRMGAKFRYRRARRRAARR